MTENVFLKPALSAEGAPLVVRDPRTGELLPPDGGWRALDEFWLRRIRDSDVIIVLPADPDPPPAAKAKAAPRG